MSATCAVLCIASPRLPLAGDAPGRRNPRRVTAPFRSPRGVLAVCCRYLTALEQHALLRSLQAGRAGNKKCQSHHGENLIAMIRQQRASTTVNNRARILLACGALT